MSTDGQNFGATAGDTASPVFSVTDEITGAPVDLSGMSAIVWRLMTRDLAVIMEKTLALSQIVLVSVQPDGSVVTDPGTAGEFQVLIEAGETSEFSGRYPHAAFVLDASANKYTVTTGVFTISGP